MVCNFYEKFKHELLTNKLLKSDDSVIVALSGGIDSVALLYALKNLSDSSPIKLYAVHINHSIREAATRDEKFCRKLSEQLNIQFFSEKVDVPKLAAERGISIEMAGRDARYQIFREYSKRFNGGKIATAHHKDDQAETIILRLIRGTGTAGFRGILPCREGIFIRPLLQFHKKELLQFAEEQQISYIEDESNKDDRYLRNLIRNKLIPMIEGVNSSFTDTLLQTATILERQNEYIDLEAGKFISKHAIQDDGISIESEPFIALHPSIAMQVLRNAVVQLVNLDELSFKNLTALYNGICSNSYYRYEKIKGIYLEKRGSRFTISTTQSQFAEKPESVYYINGLGSFDLPLFNAKLTIETAEYRPFSSGNIAFIDGEMVKFPLKVRSREAGDRFQPHGSSGRQKLKKFLIDQKTDPKQRDLIPILTDSENRIIWVAGYRIEHRYRINPSSKTILKMELTRHNSF